VPALSVAHYRLFMETSIGALQVLVETLADEGGKLAAIRAEFEALTRPYFADNLVHQDYILTRANIRDRRDV